MKKKILFSVVALFVFTVFAISVNAQNSLLGVGTDVKAKAPATIPSAGSTVFATVSDPFDFSKVQFSAATGSDTVYGKEELQKIFLGTGLDINKIKNDNLGVDVLLNYFSAYCLDANAKYPEFSIYSNYEFLQNYMVYTNTNASESDRALAGQRMIQLMVTAAFINDKSMSSEIATANADKPIGPAVEFEFVDGTTQADFTMDSLKNEPTKTRTVKITTVTYSDGTADNTVTVNKNLSFKATDILFDKYTTKDNLEAKYNHALWIIEHSYPTMTIADTIAAASANLDTLKTQVNTLEGGSLSGDALDTAVENYVYGTIQAAIWKVYDGYEDDNGNKLGGEIKNSTELDKLYKYLIDTSRDYSGYNSHKYNDTFSTSAPAAGKEVAKTDSKNQTFGPYKVTYDALSTDPITLSKDSTADAGIKIVDKDGNEITSVANGGTYYVLVPKTVKDGTIKVNYSVTNVSKFEPSGNRGRIYYPNYANTQNVITAGKITTASITGSYSVATNPKTGVENVGVLLMVTLVAFSLGYLVLSYKAKPVGLN